jgi:hypothetical protein
MRTITPKRALEPISPGMAQTRSDPDFRLGSAGQRAITDWAAVENLDTVSTVIYFFNIYYIGRVQNLGRHVGTMCH